MTGEASIILVAVGLATIVGTEIVRSLAHRRKDGRTIEFTDPVFGICSYFSDTRSWTTRVRLLDLYDVLLRGRSERPTPGQVALWQETLTRFPHLVVEAIASIPEPPQAARPLAPFNRDALQVSEVRFEGDGSVQLFFDPGIPTDTVELGAVAVVKDWRVVESYWTV